MIFSNEKISSLSNEVKKRISKKRFLHTCGVVKMAEKLSGYCLPEKKSELVCAAYLHDVTKELSLSEHLKLIDEEGILISDDDTKTEAILHAFSAYCAVKRDFPEFATENILSAVYNHTIGAPEMTVFDEIIFLSDYIEETRTYDSSVRLREFVLDNMKNGVLDENVSLLHKACITAIDNTILHLIREKKVINAKNILTRNALLGKI